MKIITDVGNCHNVEYLQWICLTSALPLKGLALINGTQMITSLGCEAVERAGAIARQADIIAALTLEVLKGTTRAFDTGGYWALPVFPDQLLTGRHSLTV